MPTLTTQLIEPCGLFSETQGWAVTRQQREDHEKFFRTWRCTSSSFSAKATGMIWETPSRTFDLTRLGVIMGVLNVTPDSFSDGGQWTDLNAAMEHARAMIKEGAEIVDVGGESTRPGAEPVPQEEEIRRVCPVVERLAALPGHGREFVISIDTMKAEVARRAVRAGASIINDVGGLRSPEMVTVVKETGAAVVVMHMQGEPRTMQASPHYTDVVREVREFFCARYEGCIRSGVPAPRIAFDPGIGFGKTVEHNLALIRHLPELTVESRPILMGVSRKSFLAKVTEGQNVEDRIWPTVALTSYCRERGAQVFRVHDVKPNVEALRMTEAILAG